jgi:hypothetical protein
MPHSFIANTSKDRQAIRELGSGVFWLEGFSQRPPGSDMI